MSVRFKFRSSRYYDSVHIGDRPRFRFPLIKCYLQSSQCNLGHKNSPKRHHLVLRLTKYLDKDFQIPRGSGVIIKRVPAGCFGSCKVFATSDANMRKFSQ